MRAASVDCTIIERQHQWADSKFMDDILKLLHTKCIQGRYFNTNN